MPEIGAHLRLTADRRGFVGEVRSARADVDRFGRSVQHAGTRTRSASNIIVASSTNFSRQLSRARREAQEYGSAAQAAARPVDRLRRSTDRASRSTRGFSGVLASGGRQLGVYAAGFFGVYGILRGLGAADAAFTAAGLQVEAWESRLRAATGSAQAAAEEYAFLRQETERLGLVLGNSADAYSRLAAAARGTALEGALTRHIFTGVAEAARVMHLTGEETGGVFTALEQIISKGIVSAEELRGQLGERLPGAFQIAARALGVTTQELDGMLRRGEVLAEDLLPRLATEFRNLAASELDEAAGGAAASTARLENAVLELNAAIAASGYLDFKAALAEGAADVIRFASGTEIFTGAVQDLNAELERTQILLDNALAGAAVGGSTRLAVSYLRRLENLEAAIAAAGTGGPDAAELQREQLDIRRAAAAPASPGELTPISIGVRPLVQDPDLGDSSAARAALREASLSLLRSQLGDPAEARAAFEESSAQFDEFLENRALQNQAQRERELLEAQGFRDAEQAAETYHQQALTAIEERFGNRRVALLLQNQALLRNATELSGAQRAQIITRDLQGALGELGRYNRRAFRLSQAAGIANAVISTQQGIAKALELGPPLSFLYAGLHAAQGAAAIATIRAQRPPQAFQRGGIVDRPTFFSARNVPFGVAGEAGPEAIVPLRRGPDGVLGLGSPPGRTVVNFAPRVEIRVEAGADPDAAQDAARRAADALRGEFAAFVDEEMRPGGRFHRLNVA